MKIILFLWILFLFGNPAFPYDHPKESLLFSHESHEFSADCLDCHSGVLKENASPFPNISICLDCHRDLEEESDFLKMQASLQTAGFQSQFTAVRSDIRFNHPSHIKDHSTPDCLACHSEYIKNQAHLEEGNPSAKTFLKLPTTANLPHPLKFNHRNCLDCHQKGVKAPVSCISCHLSDPFLSLSSHRLGWLEQHGRELRDLSRDEIQKECFLCHRENECLNCHKTEKPKSHKAAWRNTSHALAAAMDRTQCSICHQTDYCIRCHLQTSPASHSPGFRETHCTQCHNSGQNQCSSCHKSAAHTTAPASHTTSFKRTTHCIGCHLPLEQNTLPGSSNCVFCHQRATHFTANRRPRVIDRFGPNTWAPHFAPNDSQCMNCHLDGGGVGATRMRHPDIGNCYQCHFIQ